MGEEGRKAEPAAKAGPSLLRRPMLYAVAAALAAVIGAGLWGAHRPEAARNAPALPMSFDGESDRLKATEIVPTLDTPIQPGKNAVWCASFQMAWKSLESEIAGGPVGLAGNPVEVALLNNAPDPKPYLPEGSYYTAAGWGNATVEKIRADMQRLFPGGHKPNIDDIFDDGFIAYAYLEADARFTVPFLDNDNPLLFADSGGKRTRLRSFGLRGVEASAHKDIVQNVSVLYHTGHPWQGDGEDANEFVIDLCKDSSPNQVIAARVLQPGATLADTLKHVNELIASDESNKAMWDGDTLLVPEMFWRVGHHVTAVEKAFTAPAGLVGKGIDRATQDVSLRLDKGGAAVKSEAIISGWGGIIMPPDTARVFLFDRPFLVCMTTRGAAEPFFVMWVDNAELLRGWQGQAAEAAQSPRR